MVMCETNGTTYAITKPQDFMELVPQGVYEAMREFFGFDVLGTDTYKTQIEELEYQKDSLITENVELEDENRDLENENDDLKEENEKLKEQRDEIMKQIEVISESIEPFKRMLAAVQQATEIIEEM